MRTAIVLGLCLTMASAGGPAWAQQKSARPQPSNPVAACAKRGISYFKEIGSYPTLKSKPNRGRLAQDVAIERCGRTTTAF